MEKNPYNMNNHPLEDPEKILNNNNNTSSSIGSYITFSSKKNGPMFIGPGAQANLLKKFNGCFRQF